MLKRQDLFEKLKNQTFDLLVIGGGVTGAGIALDATTRGLKVALVEQFDFAFGTSSRSTKLVHGGLRYLKQLEFALVAQVGRERAIVHGIAPHLVIPEKMIMPLVEEGSYGPMSTSLGLKVYDILAGVKDEDKRVMLTKEEAIKQEPLLDESILLGAGYYAEYRTDDARLTIELIKTAILKGAICINYVPMISFLLEDGQMVGATCTDSVTGLDYSIRATHVVNATGPWVDEVRKMGRAMSEKRLHLTKGIHIVLPHGKLPVRQSMYFDIPDGRMIFAIPRLGVTYVGTTDTSYDGDINEVYAEQEEVVYLIDALNTIFPDVEIYLQDVESTWAGLRPLIHEEGKAPSELSRKNEIFEAENGLITIAGGKLTGYRKMAEKVVDVVVKKIKESDGKSFKPCQTEHVLLMGNSFDDFTDVRRYMSVIRERLPEEMKNTGWEEYLVTNYGNQTDEILDKIEKKNQPLNEENTIKSELLFGLENEMVISSSDFLIRRTGSVYFNIRKAIKYKRLISDTISTHYSWNDTKRKSDLSDIENEIMKVTQFKT